MSTKLALHRIRLTALCLTLLAGSSSAADDPRVEARKRARVAAVQSAGIDKALSREMPEEVRALPVFGEIEWTVKELPFILKGPHGGVSGAGMVVVDGKIYFVGGFIPEGDGTQDTAYRTSRWVHCYDPATDQWTQLPDLPARREYTRAIAATDSVYVLGGFIQGTPASPAADAFRLDVTKTPLAWQMVKPLQVPRTHHSVGKVGERLIVAGGNNYDLAEKGYSEFTILGSTEVFDLNQPEQGWLKRAPIPGVARGWSATAVVGETFYMLGGVTFHGSGQKARAPRSRLQETLRYDPAKDAWQRLADFPFPISGWEADPFDNRYIIAIGGAGVRWNDVPFVYDTREDRWLRIASPLPPGALFNDCGVCIIGDTIYVAGGEGPGGSHFNHFLIGKIKPRRVAEKAAAAKPAEDAALDGLAATTLVASHTVVGAGPARPTIDVVETKVISSQPQYYHGWPTVARRASGELVLVYSGGRDYHVCPFGRLEILTSRDDGANWTVPRVLADSATDDRDSGIMETSKGTLLATFYTSIAYQQHLNNPERLLNKTFGDATPALLRRWRLTDESTSLTEKKNDIGHWMLRSTDGGVSWSARYRVPGYSPHGPTQLADGRLFYAAANGVKAAGYISQDDGLTWELLADLPVYAGELHAVEAADGTLIVQVRDKQSTPTGRVQNTAQILSRDGGRTWSTQTKIADGYPAHLLRLRDGTLLTTYGRRETPFGIRAKLSTDHGHSWSAELTLADDAASWDVGYPSSVQLADGTMLTVWYEAPQDSHRAVLRQAHWKLNR